MYFYSMAVMSFFVFFCHKNIHQDDVDDNKVIKKKRHVKGLPIQRPKAWYVLFI